MTPPTKDDISQWAVVVEMAKDIATVKATVLPMQETVAKLETAVDRRMASFDERLRKLEQEVSVDARLVDRVGCVEKIVSDNKDYRLRTEGALTLIKVVAAILGGNTLLLIWKLLSDYAATGHP